MRGLRLIPDNTKFNIMGARHGAYIFSALLLLGSLALVMVKGINFGVDFTGGTIMEVQLPEPPDMDALSAGLGGLELGELRLKALDGAQMLLIRIPPQGKGADFEKEAPLKVREYLDSLYSGEADESLVDYRRTDYVGPEVGQELKRQGLYAVLFSLLAIMVYIWVRFEWQFGLAAVAALSHDVIATIGLFSLTGMEFNIASVAALLMVAGYSINDTVIVFDRIRESLRKYKQMPVMEIFNLSVNGVLNRTILISLTTFLALLALCIFGGEVIRGFVYAQIFGVLIGTYSSIFVAAPVLSWFRIRRNMLDVNEEHLEAPEDGASGDAEKV